MPEYDNWLLIGNFSIPKVIWGNVRTEASGLRRRQKVGHLLRKFEKSQASG